MLAEAVVENAAVFGGDPHARFPRPGIFEQFGELRLLPNGGGHPVPALSAQLGQTFGRGGVTGFGCGIRRHGFARPALQFAEVAEQLLADLALAQEPVDVDALEQGPVAITLQQADRLEIFTVVDVELSQAAIERLVRFREAGQGQRAAAEQVVLNFQRVDRRLPVPARGIAIVLCDFQASHLEQRRGVLARVVGQAGQGYCLIEQDRASSCRCWSIISPASARRENAAPGLFGACASTRSLASW